jgi:poly(A) polymerase
VPSSDQALAVRIVRTLRANGHRAWLVGGCVRDLLLQIPPKDFDVSTDATPQRVASLFPGSLQVGAHFGVVLVKHDGAQVEVATFRSDGAYSDGRRPDQVRFETDPRQDVLRRDFTINALMLDPDSGEVLDFVGGRADLDARVVRAIGEPERRFEEDHLRLLRAVRFAARLNYTIEPGTLAAMHQLREKVRLVAAERVRDELLRILTEGGARRGFELLLDTGLLVEILPEVASLKGVEQPPEFHPEGDVWTHTLLMLDALPPHPTPELALAVLLHDIGKPPTFRRAERIRFDGHAEKGAELARAILERLRCSTAQVEQVTALVGNHMRFLNVQTMRESTLKRFLAQERFEEHLELHRLDCQAGSGYTGNVEFIRAKLALLSEADLKPPRLITGDDLLGEGWRPGPPMGEALRAVADAQLEGRVRTREDALELARTLRPAGS